MTSLDFPTIHSTGFASLERSFRGRTPREAFASVRAALGDHAIVVQTREERSAEGVQLVVIARAGPPGGAGRAVSPRTKLTASAPTEQQDSFALAPPLPTVVDGYANPLLLAASASASPASSASSESSESGSGSASPSAHTRLRQPDRSIAPELVDRLIDLGVAEHIARRVIERCARVPGAATVRQALPTVLAELVESTSAPWQPAGGPRRRRVIALVGPTGVGKTTTIAKSAARALLDHRVEVGLITLDTWRIGAVEHISRYGAIMDVPTALASDPVSLQRALGFMADRDLVLIDTAGRSPLETESFDDQMRTLATCTDVEIHLAIAAGSSVRQLRAIRERYNGVNGLRLIVTKLDEADGPAALLNAAAIVARPIACVTNGQRVPEDIGAFDIERFAAQVLT